VFGWLEVVSAGAGAMTMTTMTTTVLLLRRRGRAGAETTTVIITGAGAGAGDGDGDGDGVRGGKIQVTTWNPHGENKAKAKGVAPWWRTESNFVRTTGKSPNSKEGEQFVFDFSSGNSNIDNLLDDMVKSAINILDLHAVYDSGAQSYNTYYCLWAGLAISDLNTVNPYFESSKGAGDAEQNLKYLIEAAHKRNMKVTSTVNLSFFWTGSPLWKQAIADAQQFGLDNLPDDSPATWFAWDYNHDACPQDPEDPNDNILDATIDPDNGCLPFDDQYGIAWRWVPGVNACVASRWALTPSVDYNSQEWQDYAINALAKYIDYGIDGFYLDAPDQYVEDGITLQDRYIQGYAPPNLRTVVDAIHDYGRSKHTKEIVFLSEHYGFYNKGSVFSQYIHADVGLWDYENAETKTGAYSLPAAIISKDLSIIDDWMTGIDNAQFTCLYSGSSDNPWCPAAMQRIPVFAEGDGKLNALMVSLSLAAGYLTIIDFIDSKSPHLCDSDCEKNIAWWPPLSLSYQGEYDTIPVTNDRLSLNQVSGPSNVFATSDVLRAAVFDSTNPNLYGFFKYDAFETGQVSFFAANVDLDNAISVSLTNPELLYQLTSDDFGFDANSLTIEPYSMEVVVGSHNIGRWYEEINTDNNSGHLNCYEGSGLASDAYAYALNDPQTVAGCMLYCISDQNGCESITIQWIDLFVSYGLNEGKIMCFLHSAVSNVNSCDQNEDPQSFLGDQYQTFSLQ